MRKTAGWDNAVLKDILEQFFNEVALLVQHNTGTTFVTESNMT
jgi:hypothetical protein